MKVTLSIFVISLFTIGCVSNSPRVPASSGTSADQDISVAGKGGNDFMSFLQTNKVAKVCDGRVCLSEIKRVSCTLERSIPDPECSWSARTDGDNRARNKNITGKNASYVYGFLKTSGASEDCDGRVCSIDVKSVSCSIERSIPDAECVISK